MKKLKLGFIGSALLLAFGALHAAEPAGKILILQGEATATRAGKSVPLQRGSEVESGDVVRVGEASSLQIRFVDESIVALRANTVFGVENFKFSPQEKTGSSIFNLVKGGMRTITGLIGKSNPDNYAVKNSNATIGIRGTHYTAVNCAGDCFHTDGSKAEDGLFGSVTEGRIVVRTNVGETEFGRDQFFVAQPNTVPQALLVPPGFVRDKLDGQAKNKGSGKSLPVTAQAGSSSDKSGATAASAQAAPAAPTATAALTVSAPIATSSLNAVPVDPTYVPAANPGVQSAATGGVVGGVAAVGGSYGWSEASAALESYTWYDPVYGSNTSINGWADGYQVTNMPKFYVDADDSDYAAAVSGTIADWYKNAHSGTFSGTFTDYYTGATVSYTDTINKSASVDQGYSAAGNVFWGRYSETGSSTQSDGYSSSWSGVYHWAVGDPVTSLPTAGVFTYVPVGGTSPTDHLGNVGSVSSRGSWTVDFGSRTIGTAAAMAWSMPNGAGYAVSIPMQSFAVQQNTVSGAGTLTYFTTAGGTSLATNASCSGNCSPATATATVGVTAFGAQAEGLGVGVTASGLVGGSTVSSGMVNVYKR